MILQMTREKIEFIASDLQALHTLLFESEADKRTWAALWPHAVPKIVFNIGVELWSVEK